MNGLMRFQEDLEKYIYLVFGETLQNSFAEEQGLISKHLNLELKDYGLEEAANRIIILSFPKRQKETDLAFFCILSWFLPPITQFELQEYLRKKILEHQYFHLYSYIETKELMVYSLFRGYDYARNKLFGNILKARGKEGEILQLSSQKKAKIRIYLKLILKKKPRRSQYKRGYKDHGSLLDVSTKARKEANRGSFEEHLRIELERTYKQLSIQNIILQRQLEMEKGVT